MPRKGKQRYEDADESDRYARGSRKVQGSYRAKKVHVYVNGHDMLPGKPMSVSTSNYPTFEGFLDQLSSELGLMWSVQHLYKIGGKKVKNIEDMEDGEIYVAGNAKYIKGEYGVKDKSTPGWSVSGKLPTDRTAWDQITKGKRNEKSASMDDGYESEPVSEKPKRKGKKTQRSQSVDQPSPRKGRRGRKNRSPSESDDDSEDRSRRGGRKGLPPKAPNRRNKSKSYGRD